MFKNDEILKLAQLFQHTTVSHVPSSKPTKEKSLKSRLNID